MKITIEELINFYNKNYKPNKNTVPVNNELNILDL